MSDAPDDTTTPLARPHPNGAGVHASAHGAPDRARRIRRRVLQVAFVLVALAWGYAIVYSVTRDDPEPLDDTSRATLELACADAHDTLAALPAIPAGAGPEDVGRRAEAENGALREMLRTMRAVHPADAEGAAALDAWLADWDRLVAARAEFATALLEGDADARLRLPNEDGRPQSVRMNEYADLHGLEECTTGTLGAEAVGAVPDDR